MEQQKRYVIIGNGTAGLSAADTIRKKDETAKIIMITDESYLTYYRIKLSEGISKSFKDEDIYVKKEEWYEEKNIDVILNKKVKEIYTDEKQVKFEDEELIEYDKLLIATGSSAFIPPIKGIEGEGIFVLRTLTDLKNIRKYYEKCNNITVLGGGLLGLEAAWAIRELGKEVNVVEFFPHLLPKQLDEDISEQFSQILKDNGINLYLGVSAEEIENNSTTKTIKLSNGSEIKTDSILVSAGIRPKLEILEGTDINYDKGIQVDSTMKTNIPDVYSAGDVVELDGMVIGLWGISNDQGKVAGENMTGGDVKYSLPELSTMLRIADSAVFSTGNVKQYDEICEESLDNGKHYKLCITDKKITGCIVLNDISKAPKIKKAIENKIDISDQLGKNMTALDIIKWI